MTTGETRHIKGWRSQMEETATGLRKRVQQAPAMTVYHEGQISRSYDDLVGHTPWFHREFGSERAIACAELKQFRSARMRIARSEWSDEKRQVEAQKKRLRRAAKPDLYREIDRRSYAKQRDKKNARRREAYAQAPELHRAQCNARRAANREHSRAVARAAYARKKAGKRPSA
ncbi:hypothetical protein LJR038_004325 [Acidovorax sp. LjRoot38]|uniref:hypothetical protein n=1 Tax=Acidovorax sp. LjRoot38 TaxID=3342327 RepID=UPI003ECCE2ED